MRQRSLDEMIAYFNQEIDKMDIDRRYKIALLGMVTAIGCTAKQTIEVRKKGKWIQKSKPLDFCTEWWYECSECGSKPPNDMYGHSNYLSDYCPNCGADMRGGDDETD